MFGWYDSILLQVKLKMIFQTSASNIFHCFSVSFFTCFVHGRELLKHLVHMIIFSSKCSSKVIKFTIKFKIFDFHYPHILFCNFQNSVSEKNVVLLNFCLCVYTLLKLYATLLAFYRKLPDHDVQMYFHNIRIKIVCIYCIIVDCRPSAFIKSQDMIEISLQTSCKTWEALFL